MPVPGTGAAVGGLGGGGGLRSPGFCASPPQSSALGPRPHPHTGTPAPVFLVLECGQASGSLGPLGGARSARNSPLDEDTRHKHCISAKTPNSMDPIIHVSKSCISAEVRKQAGPWVAHSRKMQAAAPAAHPGSGRRAGEELGWEELGCGGPPNARGVWVVIRAVVEADWEVACS